MDSEGGYETVQEDERCHLGRGRSVTHQQNIVQPSQGAAETSGRDETIMESTDFLLDDNGRGIESNLVGNIGILNTVTGNYEVQATGQPRELHPTRDITGRPCDLSPNSDLRENVHTKSYLDNLEMVCGETELGNEEEKTVNKETVKVLVEPQSVIETDSEESEDWETASEENFTFGDETEAINIEPSSAELEIASEECKEDTIMKQSKINEASIEQTNKARVETDCEDNSTSQSNYNETEAVHKETIWEVAKADCEDTVEEVTKADCEGTVDVDSRDTAREVTEANSKETVKEVIKADRKNTTGEVTEVQSKDNAREMTKEDKKETVKEMAGDYCKNTIKEVMVDDRMETTKEMTEAGSNETSTQVPREDGKQASEEVIEAGSHEISEEVIKAGGQEASEEVIEAGGQEASEEVIEAGGQEASEEVIEAGGQEASEEVIEAGGQEASEEVIEAGGHEISEEVIETGGQEASEEVIEAGGQEASEEVIEAGGQEVSEQVIEAGGQEAPEEVIEAGGQEAPEEVIEAGGQEAPEEEIEAGGQEAPEEVIEAGGQEAPEEVIEAGGQEAPEEVIEAGGQEAPEEVIEAGGQEAPEEVIEAGGQEAPEEVIEAGGQEAPEEVIEAGIKTAGSEDIDRETDQDRDTLCAETSVDDLKKEEVISKETQTVIEVNMVQSGILTELRQASNEKNEPVLQETSHQKLDLEVSAEEWEIKDEYGDYLVVAESVDSGNKSPVETSAEVPYTVWRPGDELNEDFISERKLDLVLAETQSGDKEIDMEVTESDAVIQNREMHTEEVQDESKKQTSIGERDKTENEVLFENEQKRTSKQLLMGLRQLADKTDQQTQNVASEGAIYSSDSTNLGKLEEFVSSDLRSQSPTPESNVLEKTQKEDVVLWYSDGQSVSVAQSPDFINVDEIKLNPENLQVDLEGNVHTSGVVQSSQTCKSKFQVLGDISQDVGTSIEGTMLHPILEDTHNTYLQPEYQTGLKQIEEMFSQKTMGSITHQHHMSNENVYHKPNEGNVVKIKDIETCESSTQNVLSQENNPYRGSELEVESGHLQFGVLSECPITNDTTQILKHPDNILNFPALQTTDSQSTVTKREVVKTTGSPIFSTNIANADGSTLKEPNTDNTARDTLSRTKFTFCPMQIFNPTLLLSHSPEEPGFYSEGQVTEGLKDLTKYAIGSLPEEESQNPLITSQFSNHPSESGETSDSDESTTIKQPKGQYVSPLWLPPRPSRYVANSEASSKRRNYPQARPAESSLMRRATVRHKRNSYVDPNQPYKGFGPVNPLRAPIHSQETRSNSELQSGPKSSPQTGTLIRQSKISEDAPSVFGYPRNKAPMDMLNEEDSVVKETRPRFSESVVQRDKNSRVLNPLSEATWDFQRRQSKLINNSNLLYQEYSDVAQNQEIQRQKPQDSPSEEKDPGSPRLRRRALSSQDSYLQRLSVSSADSLWQDIPVIRGSSTLLSMTRDEQKLQEAKFELIMSEALYLRSLNIAVDHFQRNPELQEVLSAQDRQWLFSRLTEVREASSDFLFDLEEEFESDMYNFQVCNVVITHVPNFRKVYLPYVTNQSYQETTYQRLLSRNPRFQQVLSRLESHAVCQRLSLKSFLILPFQRITRLRLLLQNILKRSAPGSNEELQATEAHNALEELIRDCNQSVQRMKDTEDLILLNKKIQFECKIFPLISQSRRLVKHGEVSLLEIHAFSIKWKMTARPVYLHLFNDCLMLSRLRDNSRFVVFDHALSSDIRVERCEMKIHGPQKNSFRIFLKENAAGTRDTTSVGRESSGDGKETEYIFRTETQSQKLRWVMALSPPKEETDVLKYHGLSQMQCLKSYKARENDELSLEKADVILVTQECEDGWLHGVRLSDMQSGWFPRSHVQPISRNACLRNLQEEQRLQTARAKLQPSGTK
ncbi:rho guanine nucleotide exchange factor 5 [Pelobates cultripes]|uniref:Rho guanine nucleotide exchange factor 5 n=1 Tax=Pelobates cultripes TaxID=61616 RepID=A0AAD1WTX0_PELCU|nr:rho guanine nucleotide exchange factor 5 [Pelobates cultripes]